MCCCDRVEKLFVCVFICLFVVVCFLFVFFVLFSFCFVFMEVYWGKHVEPTSVSCWYILFSNFYQKQWCMILRYQWWPDMWSFCWQNRRRIHVCKWNCLVVLPVGFFLWRLFFCFSLTKIRYGIKLRIVEKIWNFRALSFFALRKSWEIWGLFPTGMHTSSFIRS